MKITIDGFIHKARFGDGFEFYKSDMTEYDWIVVGPCKFEVDYELPAGWNPVAAQISSLEKKLEKVSGEYMQATRQIKQKIQDLQCIELSPSDPA